MNTKLKFVLIGTLALLPVLAVAAYGLLLKSGSDGKKDEGVIDYKEIDWSILRELDYKTGNKPASLAALDGRNVRVPGFVVPLDDNGADLSEFLKLTPFNVPAPANSAGVSFCQLVAC